MKEILATSWKQGGDVEEGQVSQRVGRGMKGDEDRVPWVKKLISRWK